MLYTLKKYPLPEDLSIPIQIQSLQEKAIEVIDYDYIGDAKEENYISFANQFYGFLSKWDIKDIAIITYSKAMRDTLLLRKTFRFDFDSYKFENDITISHISIDNAYIVFVGFQRLQGEKEVTSIIKFLFSQTYETQNLLIYSTEFIDKEQLKDAFNKALFVEYDRYGHIRHTKIALEKLELYSNNLEILYPYGGTDFGSFTFFCF
jgi:hypothetical protein